MSSMRHFCKLFPILVFIVMAVSLPKVSLAGAILSLDNPTSSRVYEAGKPILVSGNYDVSRWDGGNCAGSFFILTKVDGQALPSFNTFADDHGTFAYFIKNPIREGDHTIEILVSRADKDGICKGETYSVEHVKVISPTVVPQVVTQATTSLVIATTSPLLNSAPSITLKPSVILETDATKIPYNSSALLRWKTVGVKQCEAKGDWEGTLPALGILESKKLVAPAEFQLFCTGDNGVATTSLKIDVAGEPLALSLTTSPLTAPYDGTTTLSWSVVGDSTSCMAMGGGWSGLKNKIGHETITHLKEDTTVVLLCRNKEGGVKQVSYTIPVLPPTTPVLSLELHGNELSWNSKGASVCTGSGAWSSEKGLSGTTTISSKEGDIYILSCTGEGGVASRGVVVGKTVPPPSVSLEIPFALVKEGSQTKVSWDIGKGAVCVGGGDWEGVVRESGSLMVGPIYEKRLYTLSCKNEGGVTATSLTIMPTKLVFREPLPALKEQQVASRSEAALLLQVPFLNLWATFKGLLK